MDVQMRRGSDRVLDVALPSWSAQADHPRLGFKGTGIDVLNAASRGWSACADHDGYVTYRARDDMV